MVERIETKEEWRDIFEYEACYQISNMGQVKSLARRDRQGRPIMEKIMTPQLNQHGYHVIKLRQCKYKSYKKYRIHQLVALAFLPVMEGKDYVNHKDKNRTNNQVSNLEWCTHAENVLHRDNYTPSNIPF